jgi:hypothetical protein
LSLYVLLVCMLVEKVTILTMGIGLSFRIGYGVLRTFCPRTIESQLFKTSMTFNSDAAQPNMQRFSSTALCDTALPSIGHHICGVLMFSARRVSFVRQR